MKNAIVTGTSSGIGLEIARLLLEEGYRVYGFSKTTSPLSKVEAYQDCFIESLMDLTDLTRLSSTIKALLEQPGFSCDVLVNNAGCGFYGLHENISEAALSSMVHTNLLVPMELCRLCLRSMKEKGGIIVNISSHTASHVSAHGAAYGATKAALSSFSESIYEEGRKHGIRVLLLEPEMTDTNLYRNADFCASTEEGCSLRATEVAAQVLQFLHTGIGFCRLGMEPQYRRIERKK